MTRAKCHAPDAELAALYANGKTLQQIGEMFGLTRQRIQQRLKKIGVTREHGGKYVNSLKNASKRRALDDLYCLRRYGCGRNEYLKILKGPKSGSGIRPTHAYVDHRRNAGRRGIKWNITLFEWWSVWNASGKWQERGRGLGYAMCRFNDKGPYELRNVYIAGMGDNMRDYQSRRRGTKYAHIGETFVPSIPA